MRDAKEIQQRLREFGGEYSRDITKSYRRELCQHITLSQVLASGAGVLEPETVALLNMGGPDAEELKDKWVVTPPSRENVIARATQTVPKIVDDIVRHRGIQSFSNLNQIEAWLWLMNPGDYDTTAGAEGDLVELHTELAGERKNIGQMGAPYVRAFIIALNLPMPELANSDIFVAMAKGEVCRWCREGRDLGCV